MTDWFEEIKSFEILDEFEMDFWTIVYHIKDGFYTWHMLSDEFEDSYEDNLKHHMEIGLAFETKEEAEKHLEWLKARAVLIQDAKDFKPDWKDWDERKWCVEYNYINNCFYAIYTTGHNFGAVHFKSREDANGSIKTHEKEWKIYLGVE